MKIGVIGSRRRNSVEDKNILKETINLLLKETNFEVHLISGGCPKGADRFAEEIAKEIGLSITIHYPRKYKLPKENLQKYHFAQINYERNEFIAKDCEILVALPAQDRTGGSENTIKCAQKLGKQIILI